MCTHTLLQHQHQTSDYTSHVTTTLTPLFLHAVQVQATLDRFHFFILVLFRSTTGPLDMLFPLLGILSPLYLITFHSCFNLSSTITILPNYINSACQTFLLFYISFI